MKTPVSKAQIRSQIDRQISDYLDQGGAVNVVSTGTSGRDNHQQPSRHIFDSPKQTRTPIPEVMRAIDARKKPTKKPSTKTKTRLQKKQIIYDDFGEALREIWVDS